MNHDDDAPVLPDAARDDAEAAAEEAVAAVVFAQPPDPAGMTRAEMVDEVQQTADALRADLKVVRDAAVAKYRRNSGICADGFRRFMNDAGLNWANGGRSEYYRTDVPTVANQPPLALPDSVAPPVPAADLTDDALRRRLPALRAEAGALRAKCRAAVIKHAAEPYITAAVRDRTLRAAHMEPPQRTEHVTVSIHVSYRRKPGSGVPTGETLASALHSLVSDAAGERLGGTEFEVSAGSRHSDTWEG